MPGTSSACGVALLFLALAPGARAQGLPSDPPGVPREADAQSSPEDTFYLTLDARFLYGPIDGFIRIPKGGRPGSSTLRRPQLSTFDATTVIAPRIEARIELFELELALRATPVRIGGSATLPAPITSQGLDFPAGSHTRFSAQLDVYEVELRTTFQLPLTEGAELHLTPRLGFVTLDFEYHLKTPGQEADRAFLPSNVTLGIDVRLLLDDTLSLCLELSSSAPLQFGTGHPGILWVALIAEYRFLEAGPASISAVLGAAFERIAFEDDQPLPNRIDVNIGPLLVCGVRVKL